jgi:hypothetical protein
MSEVPATKSEVTELTARVFIPIGSICLGTAAGIAAHDGPVGSLVSLGCWCLFSVVSYQLHRLLQK